MTSDAAATTALSPLAEADQLSLDELFARDPRGLSEAELDTIVSRLRQARQNFATLEASGKRITAGAAKKAATGTGLAKTKKQVTKELDDSFLASFTFTPPVEG